MKHPNDLKGGDYYYNGKRLQVNDWCTVDGQVVLRTSGGDIKINKSEMEKEFKKFEPVNGSPKKRKPALSKMRVDSLFEDHPELDPIQTDDPPVDYYFSTRDYDKFVYNDKNRTINKRHVTALVESIKKNDLLFAQPILVNSQYEVIDGQHRLKAAELLKKRIYYIIKPGLSIEDAISLNINTKNWHYGDYLEYWIAQENENYIYYKKFRERYGMSYTLAISLLHFGSAGSRDCKKVFNNGDLQPDHKKYAEFIGRLTLLCSRYGSFANDRSFIRALDASIRADRLDPWLFLSKLELAPDKFTKCSDTDSYLRMMEDIINYHRKGERVRLY